MALLVCTLCFGCMTVHCGSPTRIAPGWMLDGPVVTAVIMGAKRMDQLQDNLAAVKVKLSAHALVQLKEVSALPPEYPGWMLPFQGANRLDLGVVRPGSEAK